MVRGPVLDNGWSWFFVTDGDSGGKGGNGGKLEWGVAGLAAEKTPVVAGGVLVRKNVSNSKSPNAARFKWPALGLLGCATYGVLGLTIF